jgi:hypothetical protein
MESDEKLCPRCAETVKQAAIACRHCNYEFGTPLHKVETMTPATASPHIASTIVAKRSHPVLIIFGIVATVISVGFLIVPYIGSPANQAADAQAPQEPQAQSDTAAPAAPATKVSSLDLAQAYAANEVAAQKTFGEKTLDVTGIVVKIRLDLFNNPVVEMEGTNEFLTVSASFDSSYGDRLSHLAIGQQFTAECTSITSLMSAPVLSDCSIPAPEDAPTPSPPAQAQAATPLSLPVIQQGTSYSDVRNILLQQGWSPVTMPNSDKCDDGDMRCQAFPEMETCSGVEMEPCMFTWRRGSDLIGVSAQGEAPQEFMGIRRCASADSC